MDDNGEQLDVWSPYNRFQAAPTYALGLDPEVQERRDILLEAMLGVGFSNCRDEWWHYSFGDAGWAVRMGHQECCYGLALLEPALYHELELQHAEDMKDRPNVFLQGRGR
jgi:D-alanyl-D-alanine dipeptidase